MREVLRSAVRVRRRKVQEVYRLVPRPESGDIPSPSSEDILQELEPDHDGAEHAEDRQDDREL